MNSKIRFSAKMIKTSSFNTVQCCTSHLFWGLLSLTMKSYPEHTFVLKCLLQIENKLGWGSSEEWHSDVFVELGETVFNSTGVQLSPTTLKRVWGKIEYNSAPSISTLNALSQFAGYENWRDFKLKSNVKKPSWLQRKITPNLGVIITSAAIMTVIFVSLYSMMGAKDVSLIEDYSKITFSSQVLTNDLPNSVVFDFDLNNIKSESLYIQQSWDKSKTIKLKEDQQQATGIYYFPGYFRSKLLVDGQIIREHDLFIPTHGWVGTVDYDPIPKYIDEKRLFSSGLSLPKSIVEEIQKNKEPLRTTFHWVKDYGEVSGDDLVLNTSVQNILSERWAVCQDLRIVLLGTEGALIIPFSLPGCVSNLGLMLNEESYRGKEHDLSAFGVDLSKEKAIEIRIKEKQVTVSIEAKEVYTGRYKESIGNFVGIRYRFLGSGTVHRIKLTDASEEIELINEEFSSH